MQRPYTHIRPSDDGLIVRERKLLLAEGVDDCWMFDAVIRGECINDIQVVSYGGRNNLRNYLEVLSKTEGFDEVRSIGVAMDAETCSKSAQQSISSALGSVELPIPQQPLICETSGQRTSAFLIIPHEQPSGALEHACFDSVPDDPVHHCVDSYLDCISRSTAAGPLPKWQHKARMHAFLASRPNPALRLGETFQKGDIWDLNSEAFSPMRALVQLL